MHQSDLIFLLMTMMLCSLESYTLANPPNLGTPTQICSSANSSTNPEPTCVAKITNTISLIQKKVDPKRIEVRPGVFHKVIEHCNHSGPARETLILIHGLSSTQDTWGPEITHHLCERFRVITYDLRGHGESDSPADHDYSLESMASDLAGLTKQLQIKGPLHLLGHSYGARVALKFAAQNPSEVKTLILEDQDVIAHPYPTPPAGATLSQVLKQKADRAQSIPKDFSNIDEATLELKKIYSDSMAEDFAHTKSVALRGGRLKLTFDPYAAELFQQSASQADLTMDLWKFTQRAAKPTLVLRATNSGSITQKGLEHYSRITDPQDLSRFKELTLVSIDTKSHSIHKKNTKEFLTKVNGFFDGLVQLRAP